MTQRKAEVIFVGDADSLVRAALKARTAVEGVESSANKASSGLEKFAKSTAGLGARTATITSLAGAVAGLADSAAAAAGGAGVLGVGALGALATGLGSIALVAKPAIGNIQNVSKALSAYNLTMATSGHTAKQAAAAHARLNAVVAQNGGAPVLNAVKAWQSLSSAFQRATTSARGDFFKLINNGLKTMSSLMPTVAGIANRSMKAFAGALQPLFKMLSSSEFKGLLVSMGNTFSRSIGPAIRAVSNVILAFSRIAAAAGPYVVALSKSVEGMTAKFAAATANPQKLGSVISVLVGAFNSWMKAFGGIAHGVFAIFKALMPVVTPVSRLVATLGKDLGSLGTALAPVISTLVRAIAGVLPGLLKLTAGLANALVPVLGQVVRIISALLPDLMPIAKVFADLAGVVANLLGKALNALVNSGVFRVLQSSLTELVPPLTNLINGLGRDLAPILPTIAKLIGQVVAIGVKTLANALVTLIPVALNLINKVLIPLVPALQAEIPLVAGLAKLLGGALVLAVKALTPILNGLIDVIGFMARGWGGAVTLIAHAATGLVGDVAEAWGKIKSGTVTIWTDVTHWLSGAWTTIVGGVSTFARDIKNGVLTAIQDGVNVVIGFLNDIISVIDTFGSVFGIHIAKIAKLSIVGTASTGGGTSISAPAHGGHFATGGLVNRPMFMVGEEAPRHPEYVLATNPAYGDRQAKLVADYLHKAPHVARKLGISGFSLGGVLSSVGSTLAGLPGDALGLLGKGASWLIGKLPGVGALPHWLTGVGKFVLGKVGNWITHQIGSIFGGGDAMRVLGVGKVPSGSVKDWLTKALLITNHFSASNLAALFGRTMQESGGNPRAINLWDSNAKAGHPSKGLLQTIDSTFNSYALPGLGDIWNPIANAVAAIRYMFARYGHIVGPSGSGYAKGGIVGKFVGAFKNGGIVPATGLALVHKGEAVIPAFRKGGVPNNPTSGFLSNISNSAAQFLYPIDAELAMIVSLIARLQQQGAPTHNSEIGNLEGALAANRRKTINLPHGAAYTALQDQLFGLRQQQLATPKGKAGAAERKALAEQVLVLEKKIRDLRAADSAKVAKERRNLANERLTIETKIQKLRNEDKSAKASLADTVKALSNQVKNLTQLKAYTDAITQLRTQMKDLATQAAQAWRTVQEGQINAAHSAAITAIGNSPAAQQLAAMQAQDAQTQKQQQLDALNKAISDAQFLVGHSAGQTHVDALAQLKQAQDALTAYQRQQDEQQLQDQIDTATKAADATQQTALAGLDKQTADYQSSLDAQLGALTDNLNQRKMTYAQWAADVNAILAQYGLAVPTDATTEQTIVTGPGPGLQVTKSKVKAITHKKKHRAMGGPVEPGYVYRVGEEGPEDVMFGRPGTVLTAAQTRRRRADAVVHIEHYHSHSAQEARRFANQLAYRMMVGTA